MPGVQQSDVSIKNVARRQLGDVLDYQMFVDSEEMGMLSRALQSGSSTATVTVHVVASTTALGSRCSNCAGNGPASYTYLTSALNNSLSSGQYLSALKTGSTNYGAKATASVTATNIVAYSNYQTFTTTNAPTAVPTKGPSSSGGKTSSGATGGAVVAGMAGACCVGGLVFYYTKKKNDNARRGSKEGEEGEKRGEVAIEMGERGEPGSSSSKKKKSKKDKGGDSSGGEKKKRRDKSKTREDWGLGATTGVGKEKETELAATDAEMSAPESEGEMYYNNPLSTIKTKKPFQKVDTVSPLPIPESGGKGGLASSRSPLITSESGGLTIGDARSPLPIPESDKPPAKGILEVDENAL